MAFLHYAYTFDSVSFHKELQAAIVHEGNLDIYKLHNLAKSITGNATDELKQVLNTIDYDDDWLDDPDGDASHADKWYMISLANVFHPCPSLSNNRYHGSHWVLERILPVAGWLNNDVIEIILGDYRLDKFLGNSEYPLFADTLSFYGGAINRREIPAILSHLHESAQYFSSESLEARRITEEYTTYNVPNADTMPSRAFQDGIDMLEAAINRNEDLYLYRN